jgi:hypothetical protein
MNSPMIFVTIDPRLLLSLFLIEVVLLAAIIYALYRLRARRTAPPKPGPGELVLTEEQFEELRRLAGGSENKMS